MPEHKPTESREARENRQKIALGLKLEQLETIPEGLGVQLTAELKEAWAGQNRVAILGVLKKIGNTIQARYGLPHPTKPVFDTFMNKYLVNLGTGSGGSRLFINLPPDGTHPGDLIFPTNSNPSDREKGGTLADVFEELFGELAENIQPNGQAYYVVRIASAATKE